MPPRLPPSLLLRLAASLQSRAPLSAPRRHAHTVTIPNPSPIVRRALTQPESHKTAPSRKTQLHRSYLSLIRSSPILLIFQHNNLLSTEWVALRRELQNALARLDPSSDIPALTRITLVQPALFSSALRVAEGFDKAHRTDTGLAGTSREAYESTLHLKSELLLATLLTGPTATMTLPEVRPQYLKVIMDVAFPLKGYKRGMDPLAVSGLQKLLLLGARVDGHVAGGRIGEGRVLDGEQLRAISELKGIEEMRAELTAIMQSVGGGELVRNLDSFSLGMVRTVDARRKMMEEEANGGAKAE